MSNLIGNQFSELQQALMDSFKLSAFDQLLRTRLQRDRERIVLGTGGGYTEISAKVIGTAEREGWLLKLIAAAHEEVPNSATLTQFIDKYPSLDPRRPAQPEHNPYETIFLLGRRPFLERRVLRALIRQIGMQDNSRVMVICGPHVSGKTYSRDFINYVLDRDPLQKAMNQVSKYVLFQPSTGLAELARSIGSQLGLKADQMPAPQGEQESRWVTNLFDWIMGGVAAAQQDLDILWLILDFTSKDGVDILTPEARDLVNRLASEADSSLSKLRLVLLNYDVDPLLEPYVLKEDIEPITREHVKAFMQLVYERAGKTVTPEQVAESVDDIFAQVEQLLVRKPEERERRLAYISAALSKAAQRLSA